MRMQGESCFNFTSIEPDQVKELSALTRAGIAAFRDIDLRGQRVRRRSALDLDRDVSDRTKVCSHRIAGRYGQGCQARTGCHHRSRLERDTQP